MSMKRLTRARAIRQYCLDCCYGDRSEVKKCVSPKCPLWHYRMGYEVDDNGVRCARKSEDANDFDTEQDWEG